METKICVKCTTPRDINDFYSRGKLGQRRRTCKFCNIAYNKVRNQQPEVKTVRKERDRLRYLKKGPTGSREELARRTKDSVARKKRWFAEYKRALACLKCGESDWVCLDFHHRDPSIKSFSIGQSIYSKGRATILAEVAKCDVLCSNCHRKTHRQV